MSDPLFHVRVGSAGKAKTFQVERDLIRQVSPFIRDILCNPWKTSICLDQYAPEAFEVFSRWIEGHENPEIYIALQLSEEPWLSHGADICLLAMKMQCLNFEKEALSNFMQHCALAPFGPWKKIEKDAPQQSSLRRFSNHWVAWNHYLAGRGKNEYTFLDAASLASQVTADTRDPRAYDIEHWFSSCGDSFAVGCSHDSVSRKEKLNEKVLRRKPVRILEDLLDARREREQELLSEGSPPT